MRSARELLAARGRRSRSDAGLTLTELMVTITLFAVVGAAITSAAVSGLHRQRQIQDRADALSQARTALQRIDRDIRSADPLDAAGPTAIAMQETGSSTTTQVCYWLDAGTAQLRTRTTPATTKCLDATTTPYKVLLTNLVNTGTTSVFTCSPSCANSSAPGSISASSVTTITVQISVQPSSISGPVSVSDNGTELRNG